MASKEHPDLIIFTAGGVINGIYCRKMLGSPTTVEIVDYDELQSCDTVEQEKKLKAYFTKLEKLAQPDLYRELDFTP